MISITLTFWLFVSMFSPLCVQAGRLRCELSYRRCETPIEEMLEMIKIEVGGYHQI